MVEHNVGSFGYELGLAGCIINKKYNKSTNAAGELEKFYDKYMARYITMACVIIILSKITFYGILIEGLENSYTQEEYK